MGLLASNNLSRERALLTLSPVDRTMRKLNSVFVCLLLACITFATFWPVCHCGFVRFDDPIYVTDNPHVRAGLTWSGVQWAFTSVEAGFWHPLTWLSHILDSQLYGPHPAGHHLTSLVLHIGNVLLLFLALRRMTAATWRSAMVAALFALHPLHVESVAWVAERKDVLSTFFFMLTLWAYAWYARKSEVRGHQLEVRTGPPRTQPAVFHSPFFIFYLLALFFFALGLMSKPMLATLPFVLLLLDFWPLRRLQLNPQPSTLNPLLPLLWEKLPFFALSAAFSGITYWAVQSVGALPLTGVCPFDVRVENALVAYVRYLVKTFWPSDLAVFYPYPSMWPSEDVFGAGLFLTVVGVVVIGAWRSRPYLAMGWFWFLGTLVPVIGLVQVGGHSLADRYTYVPLIGVFIMLVWLAADLVAPRPRSARLLWPVAVALLLGCIVTTRAQLRHWQNTELLFEHTLRVTRNNDLAHDNLGVALLAQGKLEDGLKHLRSALEINPGNADAHNNLGLALLQQGNVDSGLAHLKRALEINPGQPTIHLNLGLGLVRLSRWDEAESHFAEAIRLKPGFADARNRLGYVHLRQNRFAEAEAQFQKALEHGSPPAAAHYNLGQACAGQGKTLNAINHFREALRLQPDWVAPLNDLAWLLSTHAAARYRDGREAVKLAERAVVLTQRRDPAMLDTLGAAYAEAGRFAEAEATSREALALARAAGQPAQAGQIQTRANTYARRQPWREP